jgi:hypothetical protein
MATTILLYARTGAGKTAQIGRLAEDVFIKTGKKTRIYNTDRGGPDTIRPYIDLDIVEFVDIGTSDIWIFIDKAINGYTRKDGKWVLDKEANSKIGMYAFESAHSMAKLLQKDMEAQAGQGRVIGGDANTSFDVQGDGETLRIGSTKGFQKYAIPQSTIYNAMLASQRLEAEYVLWTAGVSKEEDEVATSKIIGPDVIGKALTGVLPMDFNYTFRMDVLAAQGGKPERHILYLGNNADVNAGNASALGNIRRPLDAPALTTTAIEPADIVKALTIVRSDAVKAATDAIKKRVGARIVTA